MSVRSLSLSKQYRGKNKEILQEKKRTKKGYNVTCITFFFKNKTIFLFKKRKEQKVRFFLLLKKVLF